MKNNEIKEKTKLLNIDDFLKMLQDYLENPEEMPVLTVGTAKAMAKKCVKWVIYDLSPDEDCQVKPVFKANENDRN